MPNYKLIYFNVRGRAELSRLILNCANVPFEDYRIEHSDWTAIKQGIPSLKKCECGLNNLIGAVIIQLDMPFKQIPVLEVDGVNLLAQSNTIARYLARQHQLAGQNEWEQSQADMFIDCVYDLHAGIFVGLIPASKII